ncbi:hypothetical protein GCM10023335_55340 [Streptomyces siamensis]|uniref:Uncharacterized protein n=1 Tax=Streptomyces siamensis TaxID=1274986 RepID=A0ABP9J7B2_9ACTN
MLEALSRVVDERIGPRLAGTVHQNSDGACEVLTVIRDPERARDLLRRRCAQWALMVRAALRPDGERFALGSVWTTSDRCPVPVWRLRRCTQTPHRGGRPAAALPVRAQRVARSPATRTYLHCLC